MIYLFAIIGTVIFYHCPVCVAWLNVNRFSRKLDRLAVGFVWIYVIWLASLFIYFFE